MKSIRDLGNILQDGGPEAWEQVKTLMDGGKDYEQMGANDQKYKDQVQSIQEMQKKVSGIRYNTIMGRSAIESQIGDLQDWLRGHVGE